MLVVIIIIVMGGVMIVGMVGVAPFAVMSTCSRRLGWVLPGSVSVMIVLG